MLAALAIVHVRVRILDQGYARADAVHREEMLLEQLRTLKAQVGELRDRNRLAAFAEELDLARPQREIPLIQRVAELRP